VKGKLIMKIQYVKHGTPFNKCKFHLPELFGSMHIGVVPDQMLTPSHILSELPCSWYFGLQEYLIKFTAILLNSPNSINRGSAQ